GLERGPGGQEIPEIDDRVRLDVHHVGDGPRLLGRHLVLTDALPLDAGQVDLLRRSQVSVQIELFHALRFATGDAPDHVLSRFRSNSRATPGLADPPVFFMTWPNRALIAPSFPERNCSAGSGFSAMTSSSTASSAEASETCRRPLASTI